jgi:hypothetical protein
MPLTLCGPLNNDLIHALKQGKDLVVNSSETLCRATWGESFVRWLPGSHGLRRDQEVFEWLIKYLNAAQGTVDYPKAVDAVAQYAKVCQRTDAVFKRLENTVFAHKCCLKLPSFHIAELIHEDGTPTDQLIGFLKKNSLHYVIAKANPLHKETAILHDGNEIYIRAKEGMSFLDTQAHIDLILKKIPDDHEDLPLLTELHSLLDINLNDAEQSDRIKEIYAQLDRSHYVYQSLKNVHVDKKGILVSQAFLADGIEDFEHSSWKELKPNFREKSNQPSYKLRIVTRLPLYALEKTWFRTIKTLMLHILDFRAHGHTWIELIEPIHDDKGNFTQQQNIKNLGYYFHPFDRYKRFESADPMAYMPIPSNQIVVEEIELSTGQFEKAQLYVHEVQALLKNPKRHLTDTPQNGALFKDEIEDIRYIYKSTLKSTCLSFANTLKEIVTGINSDNRGKLPRLLHPKKEFKKWDRIDTFIEKTYLLRWLIPVPRFIGRMELPFFVKRQASPSKHAEP